jgi:hypothetical protein
MRIPGMILHQKCVNILTSSTARWLQRKAAFVAETPLRPRHCAWEDAGTQPQRLHSLPHESLCSISKLHVGAHIIFYGRHHSNKKVEVNYTMCLEYS